MSSNLKVNTILPSTGTNVAIGTAGGTVTMVGNVDIDINSGISTFNDIHISDKIVHDGDTNTSIRFPSSDTITFETNGSERLRIANDGKILMGVAANNGASAPLHIYGSSNTTPILAFTRSSTHDDWQGGGIGLVDEGGLYKGALTFYTHASSGTKNDSVIERLRITSDGLVGIGTIPASGTTLDIDASGGGVLVLRRNSVNTNNKISLSHDGTNGTLESTNAVLFRAGGSERLRIDSNGTVILKNTGAATPRSDFFGSLRPISQIASTWNAYHSLTRHDAGSSYGPYLMLAKNRNDLYNSNGAVQDNDECGNIAFLGNDGTAFRESSRIRGEVDGTPGSSQVPGALTFATNAGSGVVERLRITSTGELGVNTTAPVEKLGISGNMRFVNPTGTTSRITALPSGSYNTGTSGGSAICFQRFADGGGGSDEIFFETHWQGNRHGESMRINKHGHVTTPNQPSFNVTASGGQLNSNVGTIVFNNTSSVKNHNTGNHYSTSTGRFTAPVAGRYQINARMLTNSSTTSHTIYYLRVNGSHAGYIGHNHSDYWLMESGSFVLNLSANDYVDCYLQSHSGHLGHNYASFSGFLIG